jgi:starch synthase
MKVVHVASELFPYVKTGGLADAVGALSATLAAKGHEVSVFVPGYSTALAHPGAAQAGQRLRLKVEMGDHFVSGDVRSFSPAKNLTVYLVCREEYFERRTPYGTGERDYEDNAERFIFFCKAVVETLRLADMQADIVHCHDWQAALVPILLREAERRIGVTLAVKTICTIHNIAYQGLFPSSVFECTNLPDELNTMEGIEFYGQVNFLKGGILFADRVTTVSPNYAKEIQTPEFGCGLDGVIQTRSDDIVGLINGVDTAVWNPATDAALPAKYTARNLAGKLTCRSELLRQCKIDPAFKGPVFGVVCRLVEQKGVDLILANRDFFLNKPVALVVLGSGDKQLEHALHDLAARAPDRICFSPRLDEAMAHLIEAGSDFFIMPSLFEPCGLNQMYSQAYGTPPIVSRVGGLVDTVVDADQSPETGTGLVCEPTAAGLGEALGRALALYADRPRMAAVQRHAMARDFGWDKAALAYEALYRDSI